jgi:hypothetical protein
VAAQRRTRKRVPPSRKRYEENHPVVSVRISPELRDDLQFLKDTAGMSITDVLRAGVGKALPEMGRAFDLGGEDARTTYEVAYPCSECGEWHLSISTWAEKEAAAQYMYEHGWHDPQCR